MRKMLKKVITVFTAGVMVASAMSLAACGANFTRPTGGPGASDPVKSNGGFVVEKGEYIYFINGIDTYTSDNTYGYPVKAALMRIKKSDVIAKKNTAETVIPSLMVAADYSSGIYIYGDRIYYATPNNVRNTSGVIETGYLDFKSCDLNGGNIQNYKNVDDNSTPYRFVEDGGKVYLLTFADASIFSYNTETKEETELARDVGAYVLSGDVENPYIYYTMSVTTMIDVEDGASVRNEYNQVYRVHASVTEAPYEYTFREDYLEEHDDEPPYINLGEIVLDGIGLTFVNDPTQFTHDLKDGVTPLTPNGFTYSLQSYHNGGIYFTRSDSTTTGSVGESGWLYYLSESEINAGSWNSISGNDDKHLDVIAQDTTNASSSALFYIDEKGGHHYLYVSGTTLFRADVKGEVGMADVTRITTEATGATLVSIDTTSDTANDYDYVYYTTSGSSGNDIHRVVFNGTEEDYKSLGYDDNKPYRPAQVLDIEHARSWYNFEIIDGLLFYADAESFGSKSYNYVSVVNLNTNGRLMNNLELAELNDKYDEIMGSEGYLTNLTNDGKSALSTAIRYYFYTGSDEVYKENLDEAKEAGKKDDFLYSEEDRTAFEEYVAGKGDAAEFAEYRTRSYFVTEIGERTEDDVEALNTYWKNALQHYNAPAEESTGLPAWAWVLIGVGIGLVLVGAGVAVFFVIRSKKNVEEEKEEKMFVDTTDDRSVDVYADEPVQPLVETEEAPVEEVPEAPVEAVEAEEAPVEEAPVEAAPAEVEAPAEPAEEAPETPAE